MLSQNVGMAILDQTKGFSVFSRASGECTGKSMQKRGSGMILPLMCYPCFCQLSRSEAFRARRCIKAEFNASDGSVIHEFI